MEPLEAADPRSLGPFRVDGRLSVGGMGRVYVGTDPHGRRVALKVVHAELAADPGFRERFRREIRMAATAPAWFTAPVLGADPDAARPWLATEFVEGPSLQARVDASGPLGTGEVIAMGARLAAGLAALHAAGLVHRDLKPSNVMLAAQGPRLIDFGIARAADTSSLTMTGHLLGTPTFMSPEQASGARDVGPPSDVFALGALLTFAATGRSPFAAETVAGSLYKIANVMPDVTGLADPLREVVHGCLAKDPGDRPTAAQVRDALTTGTPVPGPGPVAAPTARRRAPMWIAAGLVVAVLAAGGVLLVRALTGADPAPPDVAGATTTIDAAVDHRFGADGARFAMPSGNINCLLTGDAARCDVEERSWQVPPRPAGCTGTWATGAVVTGTEAGELSCLDRSQPAGLGTGLTVLQYGEAVRLGSLVCLSRQTGVRCENGTTRHGFTLSRTAYDLF